MDAQNINVTFDYSASPTLQRFANSRKRIRAIVGPFGSGKSSACVMEIYQKACEQAPNSQGIRRTRWAIVRNTYPELRDTTIKTFFDWFPPEYFGSYRATPTPDYMMVQELPDGTTMECEILFRALDDPKHVRDLLSLELTGAWFNEAREILKTIFDYMDGRINRFPKTQDGGATWAGIIMDTNPCDTDHWVYKLFVEKLPTNDTLQEKYDFFHQPSGRSPRAENLRYLPKNYYTDLALGKDADYIKVYVDGQFGYVKEGKIIYTNYFDETHCAKNSIEPIRGLHLNLGWDFGLTPSCIIMQYSPRGFLNVLHELCAQEMGVKTFANNSVKPFLFSTYPGYRLVSGCDPAGRHRSEIDETQSAIIELKKLGLPMKPAWTNALEARFSSVDTFLQKMIEGKPAFQLDPSCAMLRKGFNGEYKRRRLNIIGAEQYADAPEKNAVSHPHEALQYGVMVIERGIRPEPSQSGFISTAAPAPPPPMAGFF